MASRHSLGGPWLTAKTARSSRSRGDTLWTGSILASFSANKLCGIPQLRIIGGIGLGLSYIVPVAVLVKWFPIAEDYITGIAVVVSARRANHCPF